jgi:hypothetical protein
MPGMTLTLIITMNVVLDIALLGGLAFAMSRPARLTPHGKAPAPAAVPSTVRTVRGRSRSRGERASSQLHPAALQSES